MNAKGPCHQCRTDGQKRRQPHPPAPASEKCKAGQHVEKSGDEVEPQNKINSIAHTGALKHITKESASTTENRDRTKGKRNAAQ